MVNESSQEVLLANIGPAKDKHGVRESFAKVTFLFAKSGRSRIKEFWSTAIYNHIYIYICIDIYIYVYIYMEYAEYSGMFYFFIAFDMFYKLFFFIEA